MKIIHHMFVAVLLLTLQITASPLSELLKQMNATEELVTTPISVEAIVYSYTLFKTRIIDESNTTVFRRWYLTTKKSTIA